MTNAYVSLARKTLQHYLETRTIIKPDQSLPIEMHHQRAGVFVSLHRKDDSLRGCIGTFLPTQENIAKEIITNAISAATQDPRFPPVSLKELEQIEVSVDILGQPKIIKRNFQLGEPIPKILNPRRYGLIVSTRDGRRGLLLPDIPTVDSAEKQIKICYQKGSISPTEPVNLEIFTVIRYCE